MNNGTDPPYKCKGGLDISGMINVRCIIMYVILNYTISLCIFRL